MEVSYSAMFADALGELAELFHVNWKLLELMPEE